jgi:Tol biopolymer transport system component
VKVLRSDGAAEPRFSPDGRWLAYAQAVRGRPSFPVVLPLHGGGARAPLGTAVPVWSWAPHRDLLHGITSSGSLVVAPPKGRPRIVARGIGTTDYGYDSPLVLSPDGSRAAVDRSGCGPPAAGELDVVDVRTGARTVALRANGAFFTLAGWSADGRWLVFWTTDQCSGPLAADGLQLEAVPVDGASPVRVLRSMLVFDDFLSWCGGGAVCPAAAPGLLVTLGPVLGA